MRAIPFAALVILLGASSPTLAQAEGAAGRTQVVVPFRAFTIQPAPLTSTSPVSTPARPAISKKTKRILRIIQSNNKRRKRYRVNTTDGYRPGYGYRPGSFGYEYNRAR